jgi:ATP-dependent protease ClpP protease subunit
MAVPVFLSAAVRTCTPFSRFSFHAYDWTFEGRQIADRIVEALQRLESDIALSKQIVAQHTSLSVEMLDRLYSRAPTPAILAPEEAKTRGIVQEIVELNPLGEKQENIALWTVDWG